MTNGSTSSSFGSGKVDHGKDTSSGESFENYDDDDDDKDSLVKND